MAFIAAKGTAVYCNGYDLSAYLNQVSLPGSAEAYDTTTFKKDSHVYIGGLKDSRISASGLFSENAATTADAVDDIFSAALGGDSEVFAVYPPGDALGNTGRAFGGVVTKYDVDSPVDGIVSVSLDGQSNDKGSLSIKSHMPLGAVTTGTTNGTSIDNAASSASGGHGVLQVTAQAGSSVAVKVQHSADDSAWVDLITFATSTAARTAEILEVAGTINRYTRYTVTADDAATIAVGFGRK